VAQLKTKDLTWHIDAATGRQCPHVMVEDIRHAIHCYDHAWWTRKNALIEGFVKASAGVGNSTGIRIGINIEFTIEEIK
jgi:hypothetical protein